MASSQINPCKLLRFARSIPKRLRRSYKLTALKILRYFTIDRKSFMAERNQLGKLWIVEPESNFEVKPTGHPQLDEKLKDVIGIKYVPPNFVCELNDVVLLGPYGIPITKRGKVVLEPLGKPGMLYSCLQETYTIFPILRLVLLILLIRTSALSLFLRSHHSGVFAHLVPRHGLAVGQPNYAHWLLENLPQLKSIEHYESLIGTNPKIVLGPQSPVWIQDTLNLMGVSKKRFFELSKRATAVRLERLLIPRLAYVHSKGMEHNPDGRRWVAQRMLASAKEHRSSKEGHSAANPRAARIAVSRRDVHRRRVANLDSVMERLTEQGFVEVRPECFSVAQQALLFQNAEIIWAMPSGAALANVIFAKDVVLIDTLPVNYSGDIWFLIAQEMGHRYVLLEVSQAGDSYGPGISVHADYWIQGDDVERILERILTSGRGLSTSMGARVFFLC